MRTTVGRIVIGLTRAELAALGPGPAQERPAQERPAQERPAHEQLVRALNERGEVEAWLYDTGPEDRGYRAVGRVTLPGRIVLSSNPYVPARPVHPLP